MTDFLSLDKLKVSLDINSTQHDSKLSDILADAEQEVETRIKPYLDVPLTENDETFIQASKCVLFFAKSHWYEFTFQLEKAKYNIERYDAKIENLVMSIKSDKPERTKAILVAGPDSLDRTYSTYEIDNYLTREFI